jgi:hypothetical protein
MTDGICFAGVDVHARKTAAAAVQLGSGEVFKAQLSGSPRGCDRVAGVAARARPRCL